MEVGQDKVREICALSGLWGGRSGNRIHFAFLPVYPRRLDLSICPR